MLTGIKNTASLISKSLGSFLILILFACGGEDKPPTPAEPQQSPIQANQESGSSDSNSVKYNNPGSEAGPCNCGFEHNGLTFDQPAIRLQYYGTDLALCGPVSLQASDTLVYFEALRIWDCWRNTVVLDYARENWSIKASVYGGRTVELIELLRLPAGDNWSYREVPIFKAFLVPEQEYGIYSFTAPQVLLSPQYVSVKDYTGLAAEWEAEKDDPNSQTSKELIDKLFLWGISGEEIGRKAFLEIKEFPKASGMDQHYAMLLSIFDSYESSLKEI
jgi:hypothetical protein